MARARSSKSAVALPNLKPSAVRALRRQLPDLIKDASASVALAEAIADIDPEGALYHLLLAADAATRARAVALPSRR